MSRLRYASLHNVCSMRLRGIRWILMYIISKSNRKLFTKMKYKWVKIISTLWKPNRRDNQRQFSLVAFRCYALEMYFVDQLVFICFEMVIAKKHLCEEFEWADIKIVHLAYLNAYLRRLTLYWNRNRNTDEMITIRGKMDCKDQNKNNAICFGSKSRI